MRSIMAFMFLVCACEPASVDEGASAVEDARSDSTSADSRHCHWDCFGGSSCKDGVVTVHGVGAIPCSEWRGSCPIAGTFRCERGCRTDGIASAGPVNPAGPRILCEEARPKEVGDPCASERDCTPTVAKKTSETTVENTYLRCEIDAGRCIDGPAPVVADYLAPCGIDPSAVLPGASGATEAAGCPSRICLYAWPSGCLATGCTVLCDGDHECPAGSVCQPIHPDGREEGVPYGYCKPGPLDVYGPGLTCATTSDAGVDG